MSNVVKTTAKTVSGSRKRKSTKQVPVQKQISDAAAAVETKQS